MTWIVIGVLVMALGVGGGTLAAFVLTDDDAGPRADDRESMPQGAEATGDPVNVPRRLTGFYDQLVDWTPCDAVECGTLEVPVDYTDPDGAVVAIALKRLPAAEPDERVGTLVVNPGGPGVGGTTMVDQAGSYFPQNLRDHYDIVGFDPRGTGASDPIDCVSDDQLDSYLAADPVPDSPEELAGLMGEMQTFFAGCVANSDALIGHVTTVEVARDLDVLRGALREDALDYLGFSYGTTLGSTYASLFPENVGRFVLDGATNPKLGRVEDSLSQAAGFQRALESYVQHCVDGGGCFLGDDVESGLATISGLLDGLTTQPLSTMLGRELTVGNAFYGIVAPLYNEKNWVYLDQGLRTAIGGDGTVLLTLADSYSQRDTFSGGFQSNLIEANIAISCLDDPTSVQPDEIADLLPRFDDASPTFGRVFAWGLLGCAGIEVAATEEAPAIKAAGAAPILVIGTTRDPATPYEEAVALAQQLDSGVLLSRDGDGHTAYNQGNPCIDAAVEAFLIDDVVPDDGTEC
ncbi:alpha/beta hydrolase [Nocardioides sp. R-C-SC26]|uniref:alpha/beta hydrolase n=1 Tax=Nocardioides sp. R-C-SC26 TaxID=2870414 RepID=UPI001E616CFF|nr:alpha/beta hydrolase [Nocardioides sp. R-C-SC26]